MKTYNFHYDAGHGWLEVDVEELKAAGILSQITGYSYYKGNTAYLEEDVDFDLFARTVNLQAGQVKEISDGDDSKIRGYKHFPQRFEESITPHYIRR